MLAVTIDFNAPDLARRIDQLIQSDLDQLPFGVILLDRKGIVLFYSQTEARQSGYGKLPVGQNFFAVAPCMDNDDFRSRITRAGSRARRSRIRLVGRLGRPQARLAHPARQGGVWIMIERDPAANVSAT